MEAADLLGQAGDPRLDENWVAIPACTFKMGAQRQRASAANYDPEAGDDESPVHEVSLSAFRLGRYPVTVQEYAKFMQRDGYRIAKYWLEGFGKFSEPQDWEDQKRHPNRPVVGVSWYEAAAYCAWAGGRLPTEAEWERAARGPLNARYPWGNQPPLDKSRANCDGRVGHPTPVGLYPAGNSVEGLCDMLGNVWEWCSDWYGKYREQKQNDPTGPASGESTVMRGGSWFNFQGEARVSIRYWDLRRDRNINIGFRCGGELR